MAYYNNDASGSLRWPTPGLMDVPSYQVSAVPWVTSSVATTTAQRISFPNTTRWVEVRNMGTNNLKIGFTANGVNANPASQAHYFVLSGSSSSQPSAATARWELRCAQIFFAAEAGTATYSLAAGLTGIPERYLNDMSGSLGGVYGGIG